MCVRACVCVCQGALCSKVDSRSAPNRGLKIRVCVRVCVCGGEGGGRERGLIPLSQVVKHACVGGRTSVKSNNQSDSAGG